ncbi:hypothetical protein [Actinoplanes sp. NPDC049265]|uniref:hypothetical protein n=1 Tax=Actinoplanes sp. NPDC049265 TaxID=3363902 RepID=UPI0037144200
MSDPQPGGLWNPSAFLTGNQQPAPSTPPSDPPPPDPQPTYDPAPPPDPASPSYPPPPPLYYPAPSAETPVPPVAPPPGRHRRIGRPPLVAAVVVVTGLIVAGLVFALGDGDHPQAEAGSAGDAPITYQPEPATTPPPVPDPPVEQTTDPAAQAVAELERMNAEDLPSVEFDGQYAAQLASKYPGIEDPLQTTESGSHTFEAADILDEHLRLRRTHGSDDHPVILLKSTDYGKRQRVGTHFLWVTFAVGDFPDRRSVADWCAGQFTSLGRDELANQCAVRTLRPTS